MYTARDDRMLIDMSHSYICREYFFSFFWLGKSSLVYSPSNGYRYHYSFHSFIASVLLFLLAEKEGL